MDKQKVMAAAVQLQRDGVKSTGQYVTSLNRMSSEVLRLAFGPENLLWDCGDHGLARVIRSRYLCHVAVTVQAV